MLSSEQIHAMLADDESMQREAEEIGERCVQWLAKPESQIDVEAFLKQKLTAMGISEAFLSGGAAYDSHTPMFFQQGAHQQLETKREEIRAGLENKLFDVLNDITLSMKCAYKIHACPKGARVAVFWPSVATFEFRSLRIAKVWNKKRIHHIREKV